MKQTNHVKKTIPIKVNISAWAPLYLPSHVHYIMYKAVCTGKTFHRIGTADELNKLLAKPV